MAETLTSPASWLYVAVDPAGARKFGLRAAPTNDALAASLSADRLLLLRAWKIPGWTARDSGLSFADQAALNEQLAALVDRGVPLVEALEVAATVVSADGQSRLRTMREQVAAGASFAEACARVGGFDEVSIAVYRAAERTGDLGEAARRLAEAAARRQAIKSKAVTLMIYPAILMTVAVVVTLIILTFVVPRIGAMLVSTGADLPAITRVILAVGLFIQGNWFVLLMALAGVVIALIAVRDRFAGKAFALIRKIPAVRNMILTAESARFFAVMAAMTRSGVTLADSLGVAAKAVVEPTLRSQLESLQRGLMEGGVWSQLLDDVTALPIAVRKLLVAAERSGDMDAALTGIAADLAREVDVRSERLLALMEPAIIVIMFGMIGTVVMSLMLPMLKLSSAVQ